MTRWLRPLTIVPVVVASLTGGVVAVATSSDAERDPAPAAATHDVPGVVSIARPVDPVPLGTSPPWAIELRAVVPDGRRIAVAAFRQRRVRDGKRVTEPCAISAPEADLRRTRRPFGNCLDARSFEPWSIGVSASSDGTVTLAGMASRHVRRVTVAGPGGTFVVPVSTTGAFLVVYGRKATGRAVLTARLDDGTTRFFRTAVPPSQRPPGTVVATDPDGLPAWFVVTSSGGPHGPGGGRICWHVVQDSAIRERGLRAGGAMAPEVCGVLGRGPLLARAVRLTLPGLATPAGHPPLRRTIVSGVAVKDVERVWVIGPDGRRALSLAEAGRAFLAVYPPGVRPSALRLEVQLADGRVERLGADAGRSAITPPQPRLERMTATVDRGDPRRLVIRAITDQRVTRFVVRFRARQIHLRPMGDHAFVGTAIARRPLKVGRVERTDLRLCGGGGCITEVHRTRLG